MSGHGGGGGGATTPPVYTDPVNGMTFTDDGGQAGTGAAALNAEIAQRVAAEQAKSDALTQTATDTKAQDEATFQGRFADAKTQAQSNAENYFRQQGYDPSTYSADIARAINTSAQGVQDLNPNPSAAFSPNLGATVLADLTSGKRTQAGNAVSGAFAPTYAADNINDSWLSPALDKVLSSQFDPLSAQLQNAQKRGTLNDTGYSAALKSLSDAQTGARSTVTGLGNNVLANDRTGVNDYITGAKTDAGNLSLGDTGFDINKYIAGAASKVQGYHDTFDGDLSNAVGKTSFSDLPSLLNAGGAVQGATDPTATNPNGAPGANGSVSDAYIAQQALANQKRGLGSQGAF